jgi:hypothetical protein
MTPEDLKIQSEQKELIAMIGSQGWKIARGRIVERILQLQNVAEYVDIIQTGNATKLLKEMKANKRCAEILYEWLADIEGTAQQAVDDKKDVKSHILVLD